MQLIIVESPTKSKTLQGFLGQKYKVISSYGHVRDLPKSELGIDIENDFTPKYIIPTKSKKTVGALKKDSQKADLVILATDEDREGEAIAWHLTQALQLGKFQAPNPKSQVNSKTRISNSKLYQRIVFHEITKSAIQEALKNPRDIDINLVDAQQARRILDRIVGYKLSPFLWKKVARGLSAGRVQSVAVRLIAEREREIEKFVPQEYWTVKALLQRKQRGESSELEALLAKKDGEAIDKLGIKNQQEAEKIIKDLEKAEYRVNNVEKKETKRNPFPPFTTSTLQQEAWKRFHFPARLTMQTAQHLYERGLITYHRTDSLNLSQQSLLSAKKFIVNQYGKEYWAGFMRKYKAKGRAQEAHEAIRPAYPDKMPETLKDQAKLDNNQARLYDLIWRRFIACQMKEALFDSTKIEISAKPRANPQDSGLIRGKNYIFESHGQTLKFDGFLRVYSIKFEEAELPPLTVDEILNLVKLLREQHFTQPPGRYTEATLIKALETHGIGRPSTYAPIISTIQARNYIEKDEKKYFRPTEIGLVVNDLLVKHFPQIVDIQFTAKMEEDLDAIAEGQEKLVPVLEAFYGPFEKNLEQKYGEVSKKEFTEKPTGKKCPKCQAPLLLRLGKFGQFYACSKFPACRYTESLPQNILGIKCPKCGKGQLVEKRTKKGKIFYGCNRFPECDFALWDKPTETKCPKCGSLLVETKRKPRYHPPSAELRGRQIKCSNKECDFKK